jgi:hypothetical protein
MDAKVTRLILRTRVNYGPRVFRMLTRPFFWPVDFVLARKMLWGIKWRVEQRKEQLAERGSGVVRKYYGQEEPIVQGNEG